MKWRYILTLVTSISAVTSDTVDTQHSSHQDQRHVGVTMSSSPNDEPPLRAQNDKVILSDILGRDRSINVFAGFTRDIATITGRLEDREQNSTILAPRNSAISALPRKPWEDAQEYESFGAQAYEGSHGEDRARGNMIRFVEAHIVPSSPWKEGEKIETLSKESIWWEEKNGEKYIQPENIRVVSVAGQVRNGEIWILESVRQPAR